MSLSSYQGVSFTCSQNLLSLYQPNLGCMSNTGENLGWFSNSLNPYDRIVNEKILYKDSEGNINAYAIREPLTLLPEIKVYDGNSNSLIGSVHELNFMQNSFSDVIHSLFLKAYDIKDSKGKLIARATSNVWQTHYEIRSPKSNELIATSTRPFFWSNYEINLLKPGKVDFRLILFMHMKNMNDAQKDAHKDAHNEQ